MTAERPSTSPRLRLLVVALTLGAAALRFATLGDQSLWYDELATLKRVGDGLGQLFAGLPKHESTPPLYYLLGWAWTHVFGHGAYGLRSLSAVAGTLTVPVAFAAGSRLISARAGGIAAAAVAVSPLSVWYSQEARAYALVMLISGIALVCFAEVLRAPRPRWIAGWAIASSLALCTHYFGVFPAVVEAVWLLWRVPGARRRVALASAGIFLTGVALLPLALAQRDTGLTSWIAQISPQRRLAQVGSHFTAGYVGSAQLGVAIAVGAVTLIAFALAVRRWRRREPGFSGAGVALAIAVGTIGLPLGLAVVGVDDVISRNVLSAWIPLGLVAAYGLAGGRLGTGVAAVWCALCVWLVVVGGAEQSVRRPDWRQAASLLGPARQARVVGAADGYRSLPLALYVRGSQGLPNRGATVSELDLIAIRKGFRRTCWWGAACELPTALLPGRPPLPGFRLAGTAARGQFEVLRFVAATPQHVKRRTLQANRGRGQRLTLLLQRASGP